MTPAKNFGPTNAKTQKLPDYQPIISESSSTTDWPKVHPEIFIVDAFSRQLKELFLIKHPQYAQTDLRRLLKSRKFQQYVQAKQNDFVYVYYPWNNHLVKTVGARDYFLLKTNRNRDLITAAEQEKLAQYRVAVLGMSVGSNIAFALTQAGISKEITIADPDELETTNLNRIFGGVHQVGLNKTVLAARRIYEDNPFAKVNILPRGINETNLRQLLEKRKVDCLIDEIDNIPLKITLRQLALKHKVPVLMVTDNGDGIVLHIERYDLGYQKIFGQPLSYWPSRLKAFQAKSADKKKLAGEIIINDIVGGPDLVDPEMLKSAKKVLDKKLVSWSQLGSAALLGGVYVTYALKQIILGKEKRRDLRLYINPRL